MGGVLKNEFKKLFARPEVTFAVIGVCLLPLVIGLLFTLWETPNLSKHQDLDSNHYDNRIIACRNRLDMSERAAEAENPGDLGDFVPLTDEEKEQLKAEIRLCELLKEKQVFSTVSWQYSLVKLALAAGLTDDAYRAISTDDYNFFYDTVISFASGAKKDLLQKMKSMDVYPSYTDYRYLLFLRISDTADTPEDKLLIFRIENGIPEKPIEGSYGSFTGKLPKMLILITAVFCSFVASYVFAEDKKNKVPHPSVIMPGGAKVIAAKALLLVILLPLTVLAAFALALSAGRLFFEGSAPKEVFLNASGDIKLKPFSENVTAQILRLLSMAGASGAVSSLLSYFARSEIAGIAAGAVFALFSLFLKV